MWNCGSARFCLCVVTGTGLSMCLCPDSWLLLVVALLVTLLAARRGGPSGFWVTLRDLLTASAVVATVGFAASERVSAESAGVTLLAERTATVRGRVCAFPQPARTGGSVLVRASGRKVLVRLRKLPDDMSPGDTLTVTGSLRTSLGARNQSGYSEAAYLFQQGVWHVLEVPGFLRPSLKRADGSRGVVGTYVAPLRQWIRESIRKRMTGEERAFLLALTLGERGEFSEETKAAFRDSGLVHILSVSGLHTALVGLAALILLKGAGFRERAALVGAVVLVWFYCGLSGFQPPTVRAALMLTWMTCSRLFGRSTELLAPLFASCAALLLVSPRYFWDPGFQLSYLATGSVIMSVKLARRLKQVVRVPDRLWKYVGATALTTCVAQLGVLPLLALQFGSVSMVAVPANLLGIPLASGGLVCGFFALVLAGVFPWAAGWAFDLTWLLLRLCNLVAGLTSSMPRAVLELSRPHAAEVVVFVICFFAALSLTAGAERRSSKMHWTAMLLTISCVAILLARFVGAIPAKLPAGRGTGGASRLTVDFLDVGQGDAALIRFPDGGSVLVDAGEAKEGWDSGQKVLAPFLRAVGLRRVDLALVSHFHSDHAGGLMWLVEKGRIGRVVTSAADGTSCLRKSVARACRKQRIALDTAGRSGKSLGDTAEVSRHGRSASIYFVHPTGGTAFDTSSSSLNDSSIVCVMEHGNVRFILTGDVGAEVLDALAGRLAKGGNGSGPERRVVTVVKAPHHGAAATLSRRFVEAVRPDFVVFSVGRRNRFGHPSRRVVESYEQAGARVFRTDEVGCVTFEISGAGLLAVSTADPTASHPFVRKAKKWRAERTLRVLALLSASRGRGRE